MEGRTENKEVGHQENGKEEVVLEEQEHRVPGGSEGRQAGGVWH